MPIGRTKFIPALLLLAASLLALPAGAATYEVDNVHSTVGFTVRHLAISKTRGSFPDFKATFVYEKDNPAAWFCEAVIQTASVDTGNDKRDEHLRSADFFNVEKFPTMTFKSTAVAMTTETEGTITGDLTIAGVTKPVTLDLEFLGEIVDPWGNPRAGFAASGKINRNDFGLSYNKVMETGGLVVGDEIQISLEIEGIQAK